MPVPRHLRASAVGAPQDLRITHRLLDQADRHVASAGVEGVDRDSRHALLYDGARKAADAVMRASGRRVTQGAGHHIVFLSEAKRLLGPKPARQWATVEAARSIRNDMEYRGRGVTDLELEELKAAAASLVAAARAAVDALSAR